METLLFGTKVATLLTLLGKDIIYSSVSSTASAVLGTFNYLTQVNKPGLQQFNDRMKEMDITQSVALLNAFIKKLAEKEKIMPDSLHIVLNGVDAVLKEINMELEHVKDKIEKHNNLWFNSLRPTSFENSIKRMNKFHSILEVRKNDLFEVAKYYRLH